MTSYERQLNDNERDMRELLDKLANSETETETVMRTSSTLDKRTHYDDLNAKNTKINELETDLYEIRFKCNESNEQCKRMESIVNDLEMMIERKDVESMRKDEELMRKNEDLVRKDEELMEKERKIVEIRMEANDEEGVMARYRHKKDPIVELDELMDLIKSKDERIIELESGLREMADIVREREETLTNEEKKRKDILEKVR